VREPKSRNGQGDTVLSLFVLVKLKEKEECNIGRPPKYVINIGDIYDDYKCISVMQDITGERRIRYLMECQKCGKQKLMFGSTVNRRAGTKHRGCGKGLGVSKDAVFYSRWQTMRHRTSPKFWNRKKLL